jgi:hypothetical protein
MMAIFTQSKLTHGKSRAMSDNKGMKNLIWLAMILVLTGCASTAKRLNRVSVGMSKPEVFDVLGDPDSVKAADKTEVLVYGSNDFWAVEPGHYHGEYWVVLEGGKVAKYGKPGDFGTTRNAAIDVNITNR